MLEPALAQIRAALCDRIDAAAIAAQRLARPNVSMPSTLLAAALFLTDAGIDEQPSAGEDYFAWGPRAYRRYLGLLTPPARAAELEAGRRVIFEGRGRRRPLFDGDAEPGAADVRRAA